MESVPDELKEEWPIWRVWIASGDSLDEIKYKWTFDDLVRANSVLDIKDKMNEILTEK